MKKLFIILSVVLWCTGIAGAAPKYWVGPQNGRWSDPANWSDVYGGAGGSAVPGAMDSVIFGSYAVNTTITRLVHVDMSPTVKDLLILESVTLYASTPVLFTLLGYFQISPFNFTTLKDSTSADVPFNFVFSGATQARGFISGKWIFEGGVPVNRRAGNGPGLSAEPGSMVTLVWPSSFPQGPAYYAAIIVQKNTPDIASVSAALVFSYGSRYILNHIPEASIPDATWARNALDANNVTVLRAAAIMIMGSFGRLTHLDDIPRYADIFIDLPGQETDAGLDLPDGTEIVGDLTITNTNNKTLTLLAPTGPSSAVTVFMGEFGGGARTVPLPLPGNLVIGGQSKVTMATATVTSPATAYNLQLASFIQTGGNFSLQDYNHPSGTSTLSVRRDLTQTGGTFITNSTLTDPAPRFIVEMSGPFIFGNRTTTYSIGQNIRMSGGTIDNGRHMVTLRLSHNQFPVTSFGALKSGVNVLAPLEAGRLELLKGTLNTTDTSVVTITDPDAAGAITVGTGISFINGPIRRHTRSTGTYLFPTGDGSGNQTTQYHPCMIVPAAATPSVYQATYFGPPYTDLNTAFPLKGVSPAGYWNIAKVSGAGAMVQLPFSAPVQGATAADGLVVARHASGTWTAENGAVLTPGNAAAGTVTSRLLSAFGLFTIGYGDPASLQQNMHDGLNYRYYEGAFDVLPDFSMLTPVKTGNSPNVDIGIRPQGVNDSFAVVWEGYIHIPVPGTYTFETVSDDGSKLYFNTLYSPGATALVNNDGTRPPKSATGTVTVAEAGRYPIAITYFENYGNESMQVFWSGPGMPRQLIPDAAFTQGPPPQNGLNYKYYEGTWNTLPDFSQLTPVKSGSSANIDLEVRTPGRNDNFAFVWEGYINIPAAGNYTFESFSDDGSKVYFGSLYHPSNPATVDNDGLHAPVSATGTVNITSAGVFPIAITFFEKDEGETMQVYWTGPGIARQLIPDSAFTQVPLVTQPAVVSRDGSSGSNAAAAAAISRVYPNPFTDRISIDFYNAPAASDLRAGIYDLKGRLIYTQHGGRLPKGNATLQVNLQALRLPPGVYMTALMINGVPLKRG